MGLAFLVFLCVWFSLVIDTLRYIMIFETLSVHG